MNFNVSRKIFLALLITSSMFHGLLQAREHVVIVGGGMAGAMEALFAYRDSVQKQIPVSITIFEKNDSVTDTTAVNIAPSLTPDEIVSVVPRGPALVRNLEILFSDPSGIRVDDVEGIHGSKATELFTQQAGVYSLDEAGHAQRTQDLLSLGKMSMDVWQNLYDTSDVELQNILQASNFNPCYESYAASKKLHEGYRIDLIFNVPNAEQKALAMKADYEKLGYSQCAILTPLQVTLLDSSLKSFCQDHSVTDARGLVQWHNDTVALWRPGGCLDASVFIPKLYAYLAKMMGRYTDYHGIEKDAFQIHFSTKITGLQFGMNDAGQSVITGLHLGNSATYRPVSDEAVSYVLCPGEAIGTLQSFGLHEPAYAGFAGAALLLSIDIPTGCEHQVAHFNHCMEVHQEGVVLAWQARLKDNKIFIAVAGTKAFYADQTPHKDQAFAVNRNILQLNMINNVLPEFISWAFGHDTRGQLLTEQDLYNLESVGIAKRWVGVRAVTYDGFPTIGKVYREQTEIVNARCTTHLGSGGVSFAPAVVMMSRACCDLSLQIDAFTQRILQYGSSVR